MFLRTGFAQEFFAPCRSRREIDDVVVGGLVAIELSGLAAGRKQSEQHAVLLVSVGFSSRRVQDLEVAGLNLALEVDVVE
jgi:hypothetical protein